MFNKSSNFSMSSVLEFEYSQGVASIIGETPLEVLIRCIFLLNMLILLFNLFLLYQMFTRHILKSNFDVIVKFVLTIFKSKNKESTEKKLNKILNNSSWYYLILLITIYIFLFIFILMSCFISIELLMHTDDYCKVHTFLHSENALRLVSDHGSLAHR